MEPFRWRFAEAGHGKPTIAPGSGLPRLHFNVSHSHQLTAVAVSSICALGVDVELLEGSIARPPLDIVLAPGERAWLASRPPGVRWADFTRLWTVKEAYAKLLGCGLSLDTASIEFALDPARMVRSGTLESQPEDLCLESREIRHGGARYQLSLAARCPAAGAVAVRRVVYDSPLLESHVETWGQLATGSGRTVTERATAVVEMGSTV